MNHFAQGEIGRFRPRFYNGYETEIQVTVAGNTSIR